MKLLVAAGALVCLLTTLPPLAVAQNPADQQAQQKHLTVAPVNGVRPVLLSALSIQRGAEYPSLVELKGNVEIRTPVCVKTSKTASKMTHICDGETVLRADEAVFHEDTGEVEARGNVTVTPRRYQRRVTTGWGEVKK